MVVRAQDVQAFVEADHMQGSSCEEHRDRIWAGNRRGTTYEERLEYIVRDGEKISWVAREAARKHRQKKPFPWHKAEERKNTSQTDEHTNTMRVVMMAAVGRPR